MSEAVADLNAPNDKSSVPGAKAVVSTFEIVKAAEVFPVKNTFPPPDAPVYSPAVDNVFRTSAVPE